MNEVDALVEEVLKELLLDVALIGKYFAVEHLGEEEIIVLEVAERVKMIAQQDGHDFALGHLSFAVSHALISLVYGAICRYLVNSASKFLQNSSNIQNISVTLSVVIIAIYVL